MQQQTETKQSAKESRISAKRIAKMAIFAALAYAVSWIELPIFAATPVSFLKLDFGNVFILLSSFLFGPVEGIIVCLVKEGLRAITSSTGGIGELANILVTVSFILVPSVVYRFKKGLPVVIGTLAVACLIQIGTGLLTNRFINFPVFGELFMGGAEIGIELFYSTWPFIILFNVIKSVAISVLTVLLYKRIEKLLAKF